MSLEERINQDLKDAMKAQAEIDLRGIRAIKSAILLAKTDGSGKALDASRELQLLQKLVKTRQESHDIYVQNNRPELAQKEAEEIAVIRRYLPAMMEGAELEAAVRQILAEADISNVKDMGKAMGAVNKQLAGKAEGKAIAEAVKKILA